MTTFSGVPNSINFGVSTNGSKTAIIGDVGGQTVTIKGSNNIVNSIQIGGALYGGTGGTSQAPTGGVGVLPADGSFLLLRMENVTNGPMHYVSFNMSGAGVSGGSMANGNMILDLASGLKVKFSSITYTSNQINQIQFLLVP